MNSKFSVILLLIVLTQNAAANECVDLSHVETFGGLPLMIKQPDCEHLVRQQFYNGELLGEPSKVLINDAWTVVNVDDDYERGEIRQLWRWNRSRTSIIHEYVIQNFDKKSKVDSFNSGSESFTLIGDKIQKLGQELRRAEDAEGIVTTTSTPISATFPRTLEGT